MLSRDDRKVELIKKVKFNITVAHGATEKGGLCAKSMERNSRTTKWVFDSLFFKVMVLLNLFIPSNELDVIIFFRSLNKNWLTLYPKKKNNKTGRNK